MHTIRLGSPWERTTQEGRTRHSRNFGRPRTLDSDERLWLVCEHIPESAEVAVNDEVVGRLPAAGPFAADITTQLRSRNTVVIEVTGNDSLGAVVLEVRSVG